MKDDRVVPLGRDPEPEPPPPPSPIGRGLGLAMVAVVVFALSGLGSGLLYLLVTWSGDARRFMIAIIGASVLGFFTSVAASVLLAARRTYASPTRRRS